MCVVSYRTGGLYIRSLQSNGDAVEEDEHQKEAEFEDREAWVILRKENHISVWPQKVKQYIPFTLPIKRPLKMDKNNSDSSAAGYLELFGEGTSISVLCSL